jgi:hypothetical protein
MSDKTLTAAQFKAKYQNKVDLDKFFKIELRAHLPHHRCVSGYFYRSLLSGEKEVRPMISTFIS